MLPEPTARLRFREMNYGDLDLMAELLGDPAVMAFYPAPKSREEALGWIEWNVGNYARYNHGLWVIETHAGEFVGDCGLTWQPVNGERRLEVGYHVRPSFQNRGLATEAALACKDFARTGLGAAELVAIIHPQNSASIRVAERLGMKVIAEDATRDARVLGITFPAFDIRPARRDELQRLREIEDAADALFIEQLGPAPWKPSELRDLEGGFILVASDANGSPCGFGLSGFAHVLEREGIAHLEQLSVHPDCARRGYGRALLRASLREARARGHDRLTLRTFADIPWNAPFYRAEGFVEEEPATDFHRDLVRTESDLGLERHGRREQMAIQLTELRF